MPHPADALAALVDSALVLRIRSGVDARCDVLETFRAYALERLVSAGEVADVRRRHALHYLDVAERDRPPLGHTDIRRRTWLEPETANLRAALDWALGTEPALAGRLAAALWRWWLDSGRAVEGLGWVDRVLAAPGGPAGVTRAEVLLARGNLGMNVNRYRSSGEDFAEAQTIWNRLGETAGEAQALFGLASAWYRQERPAEAAGLARRAGALAERAGDHACQVRTLALLGAVAEGKGDAPAAKALYARALAVARTLGYAPDIARCGAQLAMATLAEGDVTGAAALAEEAVTAGRDSGSLAALRFDLMLSGVTALERRDPRSAADRYREALTVCHDTGQRHEALNCLEGLGAAAHLAGDRLRAARLFGAARSAPARRRPAPRTRRRPRLLRPPSRRAAERVGGRGVPGRMGGGPGDDVRRGGGARAGTRHRVADV